MREIHYSYNKIFNDLYEIVPISAVAQERLGEHRPTVDSERCAARIVDGLNKVTTKTEKRKRRSSFWRRSTRRLFGFE